MTRLGLRVSEALALKVGDVEIGPRSGTLLMRTGKGLSERTFRIVAGKPTQTSFGVDLYAMVFGAAEPQAQPLSRKLSR